MSKVEEIEKSIEEQILDKTLEKLNESELFPDTLLNELKKTDLTNKDAVKTALSNYEKEKK
ncbi:hypothetical protein [Flagellimonas lutimaris]|uniref:hypothetical protein n=1 Tax=Flagellimonas lutimaris TaxID=475082 RepID=UPI0039C06E05